MATEDWQYIITRLDGRGNETVLDWDVPIGDVVLTSTLSGPDTFDGTIAPEFANLKAADGSPLIVPWATAIYASVYGVCRLGVIVTSLRARESNLDIEGIGFAGYLQGMPYVDRYKDFGGQDPANVVRHMWEHAQGRDRGNLGLQVSGLDTNVRLATKKENEVDSSLRTVALSWDTTHDMGDLMDDLAAWTPFDYRERHVFNGDGVDHFLDFGCPRVGSRREDLRFVVGENIMLMPDSVDDGEDYASEVLVLGAGEGSKMKRIVESRPGETRLRRPVVVSDRSLRSVATCTTRAKKELYLRRGLPEIAQVQLVEHANAWISSVEVGDQILVQTGPEGWQGDQAYWARVTSLTIRPEEVGCMYLTLSRMDGV